MAAIFKKIGDKQTCSIGLYELYRITQLYPQVTFLYHPLGEMEFQTVFGIGKLIMAAIYFSFLISSQVDIFAQLQNASEAFRTYIRDGLAQVCCILTNDWVFIMRLPYINS